MLAVVVGVLTLGVWLWTGAHLGWTKTQVTVMKLDPITELEYPETQKRFVAGVEVLGGGLLLALILLGGSLCFPPSCNHNRKEKQP
jgi:hypothetical protein